MITSEHENMGGGGGIIHLHPMDSLHKGPVMRSFNIIPDVDLSMWLNKQSNCRWDYASRRSYVITVM